MEIARERSKFDRAFFKENGNAIYCEHWDIVSIS
jgi:hypothetical protein